MDNLIAELEQITSKVVAQLDQVPYEEMSGFVEKRQQLIDQLQVLLADQPPTEAQKGRLLAVLQHDAEIVARMNSLKHEAGNWLQQRVQAKAQRSVYEAAYSPDSILMDRRK
ncbi:hypothetical protein [Paenibacillus macerans]|uniref:hypothetical protein n=1 Tax=Paenibacillus macerans TaxID=44252 RepID=UPI003D311703